MKKNSIMLIFFQVSKKNKYLHYTYCIGVVFNEAMGATAPTETFIFPLPRCLCGEERIGLKIP